jgi:hypothetical protein
MVFLILSAEEKIDGTILKMCVGYFVALRKNPFLRWSPWLNGHKTCPFWFHAFIRLPHVNRVNLTPPPYISVNEPATHINGKGWIVLVVEGHLSIILNIGFQANPI